MNSMNNNEQNSASGNSDFSKDSQLDCSRSKAYELSKCKKLAKGHLPKPAHVVVSVACAVGALFVSHLFHHKTTSPDAPPAAISQIEQGDANGAPDQSSNVGSAGATMAEGNAPTVNAVDTTSSAESNNPVVKPAHANSPLASPALASNPHANPVIASPLPVNPPPDDVKSNFVFAVGSRHTAKTKLFADKNKSARSARNDDAVVVDKAAHRIFLGPSFVKCSPDAEIYLSDAGTLGMTHGDVVIDAQNPLLLRIGTNIALLRGTATALVSVRDDVIKIRNLHEQHANSIELEICGREFDLCAGQELVASTDFDRLQISASNDGVNRRQINTYELNNGVNVLCAEFEPITVMKHNETLNELCHSDDPVENKLYRKTLKMAACLAVATASHGDFAKVSVDGSRQKVAYGKQP